MKKLVELIATRLEILPSQHVFANKIVTIELFFPRKIQSYHDSDHEHDYAVIQPGNWGNLLSCPPIDRSFQKFIFHLDHNLN